MYVCACTNVYSIYANVYKYSIQTQYTSTVYKIIYTRTVYQHSIQVKNSSRYTSTVYKFSIQPQYTSKVYKYSIVSVCAHVKEIMHMYVYLQP